MQVSEIQVSEYKGYKATYLQITGAGNTWEFGVHTNPNNAEYYVSVLKKTNNPFKTLGKRFSTFDEAQQAYKMPALKTMLLLAEIELKNYIPQAV